MQNTILPALILATLVPTVSADDWPQWLGPERDAVWREDGITGSIPEQGLPVVWRVPVQLGYAGPAVAQGKVFVTDYVPREGVVKNDPGGTTELAGDERVLAYAADSGQLLWEHSYDCPYNISYPAGPRCTPTVDGDRVYTLGAEGDLRCLASNSGDLIWSKNFREDYGAKTPHWGHSAHPLVDGDKLFCLVGGDGSLAVAFDKLTGREIWRALSTSDESGYCPPSIIEHAGRRQLIIWHPEELVSLDPQSGEVYWTVPLKPNYGMSVTMPRQLGDYLFASAIGHVGALLKLGSEGNRPSAEVVWRGAPKEAVYCCNSTPHLVDGTIYGCDVSNGALIAARLDNGERLWQSFEPTTGARRAPHGTAFLVRHEDRFFLFSETGDLILARLTPDGYEELGRQHVLEPVGEAFGRDVVWSHPAFAARAMFARNDEELVRVDLSATE